MPAQYLADHEIGTLEFVVEMARRDGRTLHAGTVQRIIDRHSEVKTCGVDVSIGDHRFHCERHIDHAGQHQYGNDTTPLMVRWRNDHG